jgi:hypothetical protein
MIFFNEKTYMFSMHMLYDILCVYLFAYYRSKYILVKYSYDKNRKEIIRFY